MAEKEKGNLSNDLVGSENNNVSAQTSDPNLHKAIVNMLDSSQRVFFISKKTEGSELYAMVVEHLQLLEKEYFSLRFVGNDDMQHWLNEEKPVSKQLKGKTYELNFEVKFYPPDPTLLKDDVARHFMFLQICQDLDSGKLPASLASFALLGSYVAQAELGDFNASTDYSKFVERHLFTRAVNNKLTDKIKDLHKQHRGKTPSEAESHFLDNAKRLSLYGIGFFKAKSLKGSSVRIGISAHGIDIYQDHIRLYRFLWQNILKIAFRWNVFQIKLRRGELEKNNLVEYKLTDYDAAKRIWKCAVENHTFFRLIQPDEKPHKKLFRWGSARFRYQGRTQFQSKMASQMFDHPSATLPRDQSLNLPFESENVLLAKTAPHRSVDNIPSNSAVISAEVDFANTEILKRSVELPEESFSLDTDPNKPIVKEENSGLAVEKKENNSIVENENETDTYGTESNNLELAEGSLPHTTIESYHDGGVGSAYVVTDIDQHGNVIKRTTKTQQAKHTVQRQTYQTYTVPNEDGELGIQTVEASQQLITPIGEAAVANGTVPIIETRNHVVSYESTDPAIGDTYDMSDLPGELLSTRTITSGNRTFETITYKTEKNGIVETHVEHRVTIHSGGDIDHDAELSQAILEATDMNPDMTVEKIEVRQESQC